MKRSRPLALLAAAAILLACGLSLTTGVAPAAAATNLLTNPGLETGALSGWTCSAVATVATSPVHSGSYALAGAVSNSSEISQQPWTSPRFHPVHDSAGLFLPGAALGPARPLPPPPSPRRGGIPPLRGPNP